jgi:hypothetical protein
MPNESSLLELTRDIAPFPQVITCEGGPSADKVKPIVESALKQTQEALILAIEAGIEDLQVQEASIIIVIIVGSLVAPHAGRLALTVAEGLLGAVVHRFGEMLADKTAGIFRSGGPTGGVHLIQPVKKCPTDSANHHSHFHYTPQHCYEIKPSANYKYGTNLKKSLSSEN